MLGEMLMRIRLKIVIGASALLVCYLVSYAVLSSCGKYVPTLWGLFGPKEWGWAPKVIYNDASGYNYRLVQLFRPLYKLDERFWHNEPYLRSEAAVKYIEGPDGFIEREQKTQPAAGALRHRNGETQR